MLSTPIVYQHLFDGSIDLNLSCHKCYSTFNLGTTLSYKAVYHTESLWIVERTEPFESGVFIAVTPSTQYFPLIVEKYIVPLSGTVWIGRDKSPKIHNHPLFL